ncbi:hypothetical protein [Klebsiella phage phiKp_21]|uniref:hypothetical protein n=1 Tax=Klebsiella phage K64-1 TaxID=1439894 RepID=UPI0018A3C8FC|nr:hypothetical protein ACQ27_gp182 [Klebsiella phage K64-1]QOE32554.1 hypothetical protein CPT_Muenster_382 [Klebsiella phage Muenster]UYL05036.1 hypothetical protein DIDNDMLP_00045 [Klebsiella phage KP13-7]BEH88129.1 hypothetical protein [Klebsiella phage phiKp_21]
MDEINHITKDVFTIDYGVEYKFVMQGGFEILGTVVDVFDNGIELSDGTRLVQEHILLFKAMKR